MAPPVKAIPATQQEGYGASDSGVKVLTRASCQARHDSMSRYADYMPSPWRAAVPPSLSHLAPPSSGTLALLARRRPQKNGLFLPGPHARRIPHPETLQRRSRRSAQEQRMEARGRSVLRSIPGQQRDQRAEWRPTRALSPPSPPPVTHFLVFAERITAPRSWDATCCCGPTPRLVC
jgi:hypothetical protein